MVEYHPIFCERPVATASVRLKSLTREISRLCIVRGVNRERWHYCRRHWRIGGDGRIWTPRQKLNAKESVNASKKWKLHFPGHRWNMQNLWERTASENIDKPRPTGTMRRTIISAKKFRRMVYSTPSWRRLKPWWWGSEKCFLDDHRRIHLSSSRYTKSQTVHAIKEIFPIPTKYIDVTRTTRTTLDVLMEKRIEDYWNVDEERELADAWTGFTRFILLIERPPDGHTWSQWRQENKQPLVVMM